VAIYAGWYDANVSGPFTRDPVEFMPGAFAYHLHSFSANELRSSARTWVGPLLAKGATATMGCVLEPYLEVTPDIGCFLPRFFNGFTFGEAAYASCRGLSWQIVVVGDPLYRPFGLPPRERFEDLVKRQSTLLEWAHLQIVDINEAAGASKEAMVDYFDHCALARNSAVLTEKFAQVCHSKGDKDRAIKLCRHALSLKPSPQQRNRLLLNLSLWLAEEGNDREAAEVLREFQKTVSDYPDPGSVWRSLLRLAEKMGETNWVVECQQALQKLEAK
jgi:tetratricopeptide (TPR) repeat protein